MEQALIRLFRRAMPRRLLHRIPSDSKDRLLNIWRFVAARPGPAVLWGCVRARAAGRDPARAADLWTQVVARWPPGQAPELVRGALRRRLLVLAAGAGDPAGRAEYLERVLALLPSPHALKTDPALLAALAAHVRDVLPAPPPATPDQIADQTAPLRRLALCLDILKTGGDFTHARMVLAICANLLAADPGLRIDLVLTNERLAAGGVASGPLSAEGSAALARIVREALAPPLRARFRLHVCQGRGLAAILGACRLIQDLAPDLLLFGGGHRGPVSNESRAVRHGLFGRLPVAFFFFQASDQVDDRCDLILARGPHRIEGAPGDAPVRVQAYPTLTAGLTAASPAPAPAPARTPGAAPVIVSAIVGARMQARLDELGQRNLARFLAILDDHPGAVWHFVGSSKPERLIRGNRVLRARVQAGQVVVHPVLPLAEFTRLVAGASLCLHLPGFTGGSGGVGIARRAGVPILTFAHSDVSGRQPPETVFADDDMAGCIARARAILADPDLAARLVARQHAHSAHLHATAATGFLQALQDARRRGGQRLAAAAPQAGRPA